MSVTKIDPDTLISRFNEYRINFYLRPLILSGFLNEMAYNHVERILNAEIPFGLSDENIRQIKSTSVLRKMKEFTAQIKIGEPIFQNLIKNESIKSYLDDPDFNVIGGCIFELGRYIFIYIVLGEAW